MVDLHHGQILILAQNHVELEQRHGHEVVQTQDQHMVVKDALEH